MSEKCVVLRHGPTTIRVRQESFGCLLFDSNGLFLEGNDTVWEVAERIAAGYSYDELVNHFVEYYSLPLKMIDSDLFELFRKLHQYGWLTDYNNFYGIES
ncbi:MAG: hypothetical protein GY860_03215 [Desulfobacteraceae bacterium]|nr:hypothetical protein [Desulfobacteraceae bacterium]